MPEYETKWEEVMSRTSVATWEACRQFLLHVKRFGFTQLRKTNEGYLYGLNEFRIEIPESVVRGVCSTSMLTELQARFDGVKSQVISIYPQYKNGKSATSVVTQEPVLNPDDMLKTEGPLVADTGVVSLAGAGSIPAPSAILIDPSKIDADALKEALKEPGKIVVQRADARRESVTAIHALEGSSPSIGTPVTKEREEQQVARHGNECSECGGPKYGRGYKHKPNCSTARGNVSTNKPRTKRAPVAVVESSSYQDRIDAFTIACDNMRDTFKALIAERDTYKKERDELAEWKSNFAAMFAVKK